MQSYEPPHTDALDGLRALAILWVIPHNAGFLEAPHYDHIVRHPEAWPLWIADHLEQMGWVGVQLFFVLSGFLITRILLRTRGTEGYFSSFYARRALRILPLYYLTLTVMLIVLPWLGAAPAELQATQQHQIWLWTFLSNWAQPAGFGVTGLTHFWSLAVEEQFYLVWPLAVLLVSRERLPVLTIGLCVAALVFRLAMQSQGAHPEALYHFTVCRMDALLSGAIAAMIAEDQPLRLAVAARLRWLMPLAIGLFLAGAAPTLAYERTNFFTQNIGYSILSICFAVIILRLVVVNPPARNWLDRILSWPALRSIGRYSYAMYILHFPLHKLWGVHVLEAIVGKEPYSPVVALTYAAVLTVVAYVLGMASYRLIERPFLRLKDRFVILPQKLRIRSHT